LRDAIGAEQMHDLGGKIKRQQLTDGDVVARALGEQRRAGAGQIEIDVAEFAKALAEDSGATAPAISKAKKKADEAAAKAPVDEAPQAEAPAAEAPAEEA